MYTNIDTFMAYSLMNLDNLLAQNNADEIHKIKFKTPNVIIRIFFFHYVRGRMQTMIFFSISIFVAFISKKKIIEHKQH